MEICAILKFKNGKFRIYHYKTLVYVYIFNIDTTLIRKITKKNGDHVEDFLDIIANWFDIITL